MPDPNAVDWVDRANTGKKHVHLTALFKDVSHGWFIFKLFSDGVVENVKWSWNGQVTGSILGSSALNQWRCADCWAVLEIVAHKLGKDQVITDVGLETIDDVHQRSAPADANDFAAFNMALNLRRGKVDDIFDISVGRGGVFDDHRVGMRKELRKTSL